MSSSVVAPGKSKLAIAPPTGRLRREGAGTRTTSDADLGVASNVFNKLIEAGLRPDPGTAPETASTAVDREWRVGQPVRKFFARAGYFTGEVISIIDRDTHKSAECIGYTPGSVQYIVRYSDGQTERMVGAALRRIATDASARATAGSPTRTPHAAVPAAARKRTSADKRTSPQADKRGNTEGPAQPGGEKRRRSVRARSPGGEQTRGYIWSMAAGGGAALPAAAEHEGGGVAATRADAPAEVARAGRAKRSVQLPTRYRRSISPEPSKRKPDAARLARHAQQQIDDAACQICARKDGDDFLLCDGCPHGYHALCLEPKLLVIPSGDWFCSRCQQNRSCQQLRASQAQPKAKSGKQAAAGGPLSMMKTISKNGLCRVSVPTVVCELLADERMQIEHGGRTFEVTVHNQNKHRPDKPLSYITRGGGWRQFAAAVGLAVGDTVHLASSAAGGGSRFTATVNATPAARGPAPKSRTPAANSLGPSQQRAAVGRSEDGAIEGPTLLQPSPLPAGLGAAALAAAVGTEVADYWGVDHGWCAGVVVAADAELIQIRYADGDVEERDTAEMEMLAGYHAHIYSHIEAALARRPAGLPSVAVLAAMGGAERAELRAARARLWRKPGLGGLQKACRAQRLFAGGAREELAARLLRYETEPFQLDRSGPARRG
jgi:hypothetical protein